MKTDCLGKDIEKSISEKETSMNESILLKGEQGGSLARSQVEESAAVAGFLTLMLFTTVLCQGICPLFSVFTLAFSFTQQLSSCLHKKSKNVGIHDKDNSKTDGDEGQALVAKVSDLVLCKSFSFSPPPSPQANSHNNT